MCGTANAPANKPPNTDNSPRSAAANADCSKHPDGNAAPSRTNRELSDLTLVDRGRGTIYVPPETKTMSRQASAPEVK